MVGGRGPKWLEQTLRQAAELQEDFRFLGFTTRGDALHALAQFYRLAPDAWYMGLVGTRGNLDRAVELSRQAVAIQPRRIEYHKELGVALLCRGRSDDLEAAARELREVLALPAITPLDQVDQRHARRLLEQRPANVCWYSRDGFQEPAA
jgi:hypothetical protein